MKRDLATDLLIGLVITIVMLIVAIISVRDCGSERQCSQSGGTWDQGACRHVE